MNETILDQPEKTIGADYPPRLRDYRLNYADYIVNLVLTASVVVICLFSLLEDDALFFALLIMPILGGYQLLSALIGAIRGNREKLIYLVVALLFIGGMTLVAILLEEYGGRIVDSEYSIFISGMLLSFGGACYYTYLCYRAKKRTAI